MHALLSACNIHMHVCMYAQTWLARLGLVLLRGRQLIKGLLRTQGHLLLIAPARFLLLWAQLLDARAKQGCSSLRVQLTLLDHVLDSLLNLLQICITC